MKIIFIFLVTQIIWISNSLATSKLNIFACEPEWSSLAKEIGGDKIKTFSATHFQNKTLIILELDLVLFLKYEELIYLFVQEQA